MSQLPLSQVGKMHLHLWLITFHSSTFKKLAVNPLENYVHLPWMLTPVGLTEILVSTAFLFIYLIVTSCYNCCHVGYSFY